LLEEVFQADFNWLVGVSVVELFTSTRFLAYHKSGDVFIGECHKAPSS